VRAHPFYTSVREMYRRLGILTPMGHCDVCAIELSEATGFDVRLDIRREYAMGGNELPLRIVRTGEHRYCSECAKAAPESKLESIIVATAAQAEFLSPIYERHGLPPVREFDEVPPRIEP
jgi:hypothetical protein